MEALVHTECRSQERRGGRDDHSDAPEKTLDTTPVGHGHAAARTSTFVSRTSVYPHRHDPPLGGGGAPPFIVDYENGRGKGLRRPISDVRGTFWTLGGTPPD